MKKSFRPLSFLFLTTFLVTLLNGMDFSQTPPILTNGLRIEQPATAKSSGGRSGGGSFKRDSSGSRSSGSSSPSRSRSNSNSRSRSRTTSPSYHNDSYERNDSDQRDYSSGSSYSSQPNPFAGLIIMMIFLGIGGLVLFSVVYSILKGMVKSFSPEAKQERIRENDIFTISKVQVALLAYAEEVQTTLSDLSTSIDTDTPEGLRQLYNESIITLLRHENDWTHVSATSKRVNLENAEAVFGEFSLEEREKFNVESLSNVNGHLRQRDVKLEEDESACYVVVTLIAGTAHDKPLFEEIREKEALKTALKQLALIPTDYLLRFEVLWSPQTPEDTMTYDEFVLEYTDMVNLV